MGVRFFIPIAIGNFGSAEYRVYGIESLPWSHEVSFNSTRKNESLPTITSVGFGCFTCYDLQLLLRICHFLFPLCPFVFDRAFIQPNHAQRAVI